MVFGQKPFNVSCASFCDDEYSGLPHIGDGSDFSRSMSTLRITQNDAQMEDNVAPRGDFVADPSNEISFGGALLTDVYGAMDCPDSLPEEAESDVPTARQVILVQGGTEMQPPIGLGGNRIYDVNDGVDGTDAATCGQVMLLDGSNAMTDGPMDLEGFGIENLAQGTESTDAATCGQVMLLDGSNSMTDGPIDLGSFGIENLAQGTESTDAETCGQVMLLDGSNAAENSIDMANNCNS